MPEQSDFDRRLRAVERALTDGDHDVTGLEDAAAIDDRLTALETRIDALEERTAELDAATQAVRGYVGNVRSVNDEVEARADAALAAVDRIEARLDGREEFTETDRSGPSGRNRDHSPRQCNQASGSPNRATGTTDTHGIEMPPSRGDDRSTADAGEADDPSVIERVREVL